MNAIELSTVTAPFPTIMGDGERRDGLLFSQPAICRNCQTGECRHGIAVDPPSVSHTPCRRGVSVFYVPFGDSTLVVNGVFEPVLNKSANSRTRAALRSNHVRLSAVTVWKTKLTNLAGRLPEGKEGSFANWLHVFRNHVDAAISAARALVDGNRSQNTDATIRIQSAVLSLWLDSVRSDYLFNTASIMFQESGGVPLLTIFEEAANSVNQLSGDPKVNITVSGEPTLEGKVYRSILDFALLLLGTVSEFASGTILVSVKRMREAARVRIEWPGAEVCTSNGVLNTDTCCGELQVPLAISAAHGFNVVSRRKRKRNNIIEFDVPMRVVRPAVIAEHGTYGKKRGNRSRTKKVLIIDDSVDEARYVAEVFVDGGWQVYAAASGEEGLKIAIKMDVDVIICDAHLPRESGADVVRRARRAGVLCPVVFYTGLRAEDMQIMAGGIEDWVYVGKPDFDVLLSEAERLLTASKHHCGI